MSRGRFHRFNYSYPCLKFIRLKYVYGRHVLLNFIKKCPTSQRSFNVHNFRTLQSMCPLLQVPKTIMLFLCFYRTLDISQYQNSEASSGMVFMLSLKKWPVIACNADSSSWTRRLAVGWWLPRFLRRNPKETSVYSLCSYCSLNRS
jgi:hypothetical protein